MVNVCSVCRHSQRREIDTLLVTRSRSMRDIAGQFQVSKSAVARHRKTCLPELLSRAYEAEKVAASDLLATARALMAKSISILTRAEQRHDWNIALRGIAEARHSLALLAEMRGELSRQPNVQVLVTSPAWIELRTSLIEVLERYPAARNEILDVFQRLELTDGKS